MRARRAIICGLVAAACAAVACGEPGSTEAPINQITPGTYTGSDASGGLYWTIQQSGQAVSGTGTFLATGGTTAVTYSLRGTFANGVLEVRLVGAPGDTDADSVWFSGRAATELYGGAAFSGSLYGSEPALFGQLEMDLTITP